MASETDLGEKLLKCARSFQSATIHCCGHRQSGWVLPSRKISQFQIGSEVSFILFPHGHHNECHYVMSRIFQDGRDQVSVIFEPPESDTQICKLYWKSSPVARGFFLSALVEYFLCLALPS
jgi:hypothetical protein